MDSGMFEQAEPQEVDRVDAVPCDDPHHNEVYGIFDLPDGDFPGDEEVLRLAEEGCVERFTDFAGTALDETWLDLTYLFPTRQSWETLDDRAVSCAVFDPEGLLVGSVEGAGDEYLIPVAGDCLDVDGLQVDCAGEHDSELYLLTEIHHDEYPGDQAIEDEAVELCEEAFSGYVGIDYQDSELDFLYIMPDQQSWDLGDRSVMCAVYDRPGR